MKTKAKDYWRALHSIAAIVENQNWSYSAGLIREVADELVRLEREYQKCQSALLPFTHPDLNELLGGNVQGDASIVFQRNHAKLTIGDFRRAAEAVLDKTMRGMYKTIDELDEIYKSGYIDGLEAQAHWKDGEQFVGTTGKRLSDAIAQCETAFNFDPPGGPRVSEEDFYDG